MSNNHAPYNMADYAALLRSGVSAALAETSDLRFDGEEDASLYFARELDHVKAKTYDKIYPEMTALKFFPSTNEADPGAESVTYYSYESTREAVQNVLYSDPSVFVRELIQNAIDAVRTREQLDKNLPSDWKGQINIRCWMDQEGYHWFRIEDNGIGMTEDIIMNYFLKIGSSYYSSDTFLKAKLQCNADPDYMPISRFGIGILSCFMGDNETNQVEISTKHFKEGNIYHPALRLSMHGINGYYYLSNKDKRHIHNLCNFQGIGNC